MFSTPFSFDLHENMAGIKINPDNNLTSLDQQIPTFNEMYYYKNFFINPYTPYHVKPIVAAGSVAKSSRLCWMKDNSSKVGMMTLLTVGSSHINQIHLVLDYLKIQNLKNTSYASIDKCRKIFHQNLINNKVHLKK